MVTESGVLIISDLHLGPGGASGELEHFREDDAFCEFLDFYAKSPEHRDLELIIAGDFFDSIQVMLGEGLPDRVYEHQAVAKIQRIIQGHPSVFKALGQFAKCAGRRVTFLAGNHDPAIAFPAVQKLLRALIEDNVLFETSAVVRSPLIVKHGNEWDAANRFETDAIIRQNALGSFVQFPWGSYLVIGFLSRVRKSVPDIDKIKPVGAFIRWAILHKPRSALIAAFHFVRFVWRYRFHRNSDQRISFHRLLRILRGTCYSCDLVHRATRFMTESPSCVLVVGHTHRAMAHRLSDKHVYVNTGTWNPILVFERGRFTSVQFPTYALYSAPRLQDGTRG